MRDYRKLKVWEGAHKLCLSVYGMTSEFPADEKFGLVSQMRRSASSIPTNIAEGSGRRSHADYARFLDMATGSCNEIEYQIYLAHSLGYVHEASWTEAAGQIEEIRRMLVGLADAVRSEDGTG